MKKKNFYQAMKEDALGFITAYICQFDEECILALLMTVEDNVLAYVNKKYGEVISNDEMFSIKQKVREMFGPFEMNENEVELIDNSSFEIQRKDTTISDDEHLPFE